MNVLIPMGGLGSRFSEKGFRYPKPLVNIVGRPMLFRLLDGLSLTSEDCVWIAVKKELDEDFSIEARLVKEFPRVQFRFTFLTFNTRGATETLLTILESMPSESLSRRTLSLDCDTIYLTDILASFRELDDIIDGCCYYFEDEGSKPIYSYIQLDKDHRIKAIAEKNKISTHANTGAYGFRSASLMRTHCIAVLDGAVGSSGEYYTSSAISHCISSGGYFVGIPSGDFACVGTPSELEAFLLRVRGGNVPSKFVKQMRFCFDLDNTLVSYPLVEGDYSTVEPKSRTIALLQDLKAAGHYIIIATARRMKTHNGNVGAVVRDIGMLTMQTLEKFGIPYDELHFGKPQADLYIDDLAVNAMADTEKEVGWIVPQKYVKSSTAPTIPSRNFNSVLFMNDVVIKSSLLGNIAGELFFYESIPSSISDLFPRLCESQRPKKYSDMCSFAIDKIDGAVFSHLLVNRCLTAGRLEKLVVALQRIHNCKDDSVSHDLTSVNVYANLSLKLASRFEEFRNIYNVLQGATGIAVSELMENIKMKLDDYESSDRALRAHVIHGDPVFSNALLCKDGRIKFIDMRGKQGDILSLSGDKCYDYAKVYQSLLGYDFVILDKEPSSTDKDYLNSLQSVFWNFIESNHGSHVTKKDIQFITASLFFSLLPLHDKFEHRIKFLMMSNDIMYAS